MSDPQGAINSEGIHVSLIKNDVKVIILPIRVSSFKNEVKVLILPSLFLLCSAFFVLYIYAFLDIRIPSKGWNHSVKLAFRVKRVTKEVLEEAYIKNNPMVWPSASQALKLWLWALFVEGFPLRHYLHQSRQGYLPKIPIPSHTPNNQVALFCKPSLKISPREEGQSANTHLNSLILKTTLKSR